MPNFSFDIVSDYDKAEMNNVFDQTRREIQSRYDFKGTPAELDWIDADKSGFKVTGSGEWQIDAIVDIVRKKLAARNLSQKLLDTGRAVSESNMKSVKEIPFVYGLNQDKAKTITRLLRDSGTKAKFQIQGEAIRVTSSSKDELQSLMSLVRSADLDFPISFTNYR